ncbi:MULTISPECIES: HNH endonuclease [Bacillaceae]|uniref:HNH endonuclease n=1 Tax=Bacillaceae TaxID=186817 RepID=UPI00047EB5AF|nr:MULTISPECIES: HNH endonuclease [Bacillaceae]UOE93125.1 HNH endonuclease [Alkalihalobacillus sp. LMS39]
MVLKKRGACELCLRTDIEQTVHHLIPREEGGALLEKAMLCIPCHKQIHALYSNRELAIRLHTIEALQADEKIQSYLRWIKKQPSTVLTKVKKSKTR